MIVRVWGSLLLGVLGCPLFLCLFSLSQFGGVCFAQSITAAQVSGVDSVVPGVKPGSGSSLVPTVVAVDGGGRHSMALLSDGTVLAWGHNDEGQLGNGGLPGPFVIVDSKDATRVVDPLDPSGELQDIIEISAGSEHSLALKADGTVWVWGTNANSALGNFSGVPNSSVPVQVWEGSLSFPSAPLSDVVSVRAGTDFSLALKSDGTVWGWGWNPYGQLGHGDGQYADLAWAGPAAITDVKKISTTRGFHVLAVKNDKSLWAWGQNGDGQLGLGYTSPAEDLPTLVPGISNVLNIAAGRRHSVARTSTSQSIFNVWTWGDNLFGQLGDGSNDDRSAPGQVLITNISGIRAGAWHTIARRTRNVYTWGANDTGQLGNGGYSLSASSNFPVQVQLTPNMSVPDVLRVSAGWQHNVVMKREAEVWGWGSNGWGQLEESHVDQVYAIPLPVPY